MCHAPGYSKHSTRVTPPISQQPTERGRTPGRVRDVESQSLQLYPGWPRPTTLAIPEALSRALANIQRLISKPMALARGGGTALPTCRSEGGRCLVWPSRGQRPLPPAQGWDTGPLASRSHGSWKPFQHDGLGPANRTILPLQTPRCQEPPTEKGPFRALEKL